MLVLSRKAGQSIVISDDIEITVTRIHNGRVCLGIAAPQNINIRRAELPARSSAHSSPHGGAKLSGVSAMTKVKERQVGQVFLPGIVNALDSGHVRVKASPP